MKSPQSFSESDACMHDDVMVVDKGKHCMSTSSIHMNNNFQINKFYQLEHYIIIMRIQLWCIYFESASEICKSQVTVLLYLVHLPAGFRYNAWL